ncbi:MAG: dockerin type I repeat-containing protein, partial [Planctomycetota bacterium]
EPPCGFGTPNSEGSYSGVAVHPGIGEPVHATSFTGGRVLSVARIFESPKYARVACYLANGWLDRSFGDDGTIDLKYGTHPFRPRKIFFHSKRGLNVIYVAGNVTIDENHSLLVTRLTMSGQQDRSFGDDGWSLIGFGDDEWEYLEDAAVTPDGKLVVLSGPQLENWGTAFEVALAKVLPNGQLDRSFGDDGKWTEKFRDASHGGVRPKVLHITREGELLIGGHLWNEHRTPFFLSLNADGSRSGRFGFDGFRPMQRYFMDSTPTHIIGMGDDKFLIVATDRVYQLVGTSFNERFADERDGFAIAPLQVRQIVLGFDAFYVLAEGGSVWAFHLDGTPKETWGQEGRLVLDISPDLESRGRAKTLLIRQGAILAVGNSITDQVLAQLDFHDGLIVEDDCGNSSVRFQAGDPNGSGRIDVSDAVASLEYLFLGSDDVQCPQAIEVNEDGAIDLSDAVAILSYLFLGQRPPQITGDCKSDTARDGVPCETNSSCE